MAAGGLMPCRTGRQCGSRYWLFSIRANVGMEAAQRGERSIYRNFNGLGRPATPQRDAGENPQRAMPSIGAHRKYGAPNVVAESLRAPRSESGCPTTGRDLKQRLAQ